MLFIVLARWVGEAALQGQAKSRAEAFSQSRSGLFPQNRGRRIRQLLGKTLLHLTKLFPGEPERFGGGRDAVPELLSELDALRFGQLQQVGTVRRAHVATLNRTHAGHQDSQQSRPSPVKTR